METNTEIIKQVMLAMEKKYWQGGISDFVVNNEVISNHSMLEIITLAISTTQEQAVAEYRGKIEGLKRKHYEEEKPFLKHRNDYNDAYNAVLDQVLELLSDNQIEG